MAKRLARSYRRETLLLLAADSARLATKELEQQARALENRLVEMAESRQYRVTGKLPLPELPVSPEVDRLLGLGSTPPH